MRSSSPWLSDDDSDCATIAVSVEHALLGQVHFKILYLKTNLSEDSQPSEKVVMTSGAARARVDGSAQRILEMSLFHERNLWRPIFIYEEVELL